MHSRLINIDLLYVLLSEAPMSYWIMLLQPRRTFTMQCSQQNNSYVVNSPFLQVFQSGCGFSCVIQVLDEAVDWGAMVAYISNSLPV